MTIIFSSPWGHTVEVDVDELIDLMRAGEKYLHALQKVSGVSESWVSWCTPNQPLTARATGNGPVVSRLGGIIALENISRFKAMLALVIEHEQDFSSAARLLDAVDDIERQRARIATEFLRTSQGFELYAKELEVEKNKSLVTMSCFFLKPQATYETPISSRWQEHAWVASGAIERAALKASSTIQWPACPHCGELVTFD